MERDKTLQEGLRRSNTRAARAMERDKTLQAGLRRSNTRFMATMNRILEQYNHPFEDDLLVSMATLTYDTPEGPKQWEQVSTKDIKNWKKMFKHNRRSQRNTEISEKQSSDFEDDLLVHQESPENAGMDTSDSGEERGDTGSVRKKCQDVQLQNQNTDDGQILVKKRVPVDVIVQDDERNIPKWITITIPRSSKDRLTLPAEDEFEISEKQSSDFEDDLLVHQESPENAGMDTSDSGEERGDTGSVRKKCQDVQLQNQNTDDGQILVKKRVPVDVIVQDDERNIPKWITITIPRSSKDRLTLPAEDEFGNEVAACRKKLDLSNECSSSKHGQLQHSCVPILSNTIASPRQQPCPGLSTASCDSIHGEYQSADETCSWNNTTIRDLYPAMLEILTKLMKRSQRKMLKRMFRHLRSKKQRSRKTKLSVTVEKTGESGPCELKKAFHGVCSCRSDNNQNLTSGNESRDFCPNSGLISSSSGLAPYANSDENEINMDYSDADLEEHLASGKGQEVCKHTAFPDTMYKMGETFLVEDELQTTASPKSSEYTGSEKFAYKRFSEPSFIISTASSDSRALHLLKERKTQKTDFGVGTSELCSYACSSHGNSNNSIPITSCSPARSSNTVFTNPERVIPERQTSFQHKDSFSSCFMKQSPSKMPCKCKDAFEELYYKVCSEELQKSLTLPRPLSNSQNLEEKGRLVKSNSSDFGRSIKQGDREFDRLYEKLSVPGNRWESVPKFPRSQTVTNFRKYEEMQMPETVNALVYSPVRSYSAISKVKRRGNSENCLLCSPLKRLKLTPERCISSGTCQEISHSKKCNPQRAGMDFLSTYNCSNPSYFADHSCHCQGPGSHDASDTCSLGVPGTFLQESRTAGAHSGCPGAVGNGGCLRNVRKHRPRVYRKLSYTDGKDQL